MHRCSRRSRSRGQAQSGAGPRLGAQEVNHEPHHVAATISGGPSATHIFALRNRVVYSTRPRQISYAHKYCIIRHAVTSRPAVKNCNSSGLELQLTSEGAAGGSGVASQSMTRRRSHIVVRQYLRIESLIEAIKRWLQRRKRKRESKRLTFQFCYLPPPTLLASPLPACTPSSSWAARDK